MAASSRGSTEALRRYWSKGGQGGATIKWGTKGSFDRCAGEGKASTCATTRRATHPTPHAMHVDDLIRHETPASEPDCMCGSEIAQYLAMVSPQGGSCPVTLSTAASRARPTRHTPAKTLRSYSRNVTNKCPICVIPGGISPTPAKVESAGIRAALGYGSGACGYDSL